MAAENSCPICGNSIEANALHGLCAECMLKGAFPTDSASLGDDPSKPNSSTFVPPTPDELATRFPQLEILQMLGRGGMGAVYKARQKELDRIVALKILPPGIGETPGFAERFTREAKALAKLNHPNIVTLYEFGRTDGLFFFLMEYVDGVNLRQLLGAGRVAPREALAIVPQICDALQYAHDQGIVHRDIKPDNILMDRRGRVKVADFGLAKIVSEAAGSGSAAATAEGAQAGASGTTPSARELTEAGKVMGTPQYMAPEQADHPTEVDHRADIYALGVVFYQMLTGELPGKRIEAPSKKVHIDVRLDEIVLRALEKKPEFRYQQASVLKTEVENVTRTAAPEDTRIEQAPASIRSYNPWEPTITVIGTVFFIVLMVIAAGQSPEVGRAVIAICVIGLIICGLTFAGIWPFPSPWFPEPNFSSRNLRRANTGEPPNGESRDERRRPKMLQYGFITSLIGFPVGIALNLPVVWGLSLAGIVIGGLKLMGIYRDNPTAGELNRKPAGEAKPSTAKTTLEYIALGYFFVGILGTIVWMQLTNWLYVSPLIAGSVALLLGLLCGLRKRFVFATFIALLSFGVIAILVVESSQREKESAKQKTQERLNELRWANSPSFEGSAFEPKAQFAAKLPDGSFVELVSLIYGPGGNPRRTQGVKTNLIDFWKPDGTRNEEYGRWSFGPGTLSSARDPALEYRGIVARWEGPDTNNVRLMDWQLGENPQESADGQFPVMPKGESAENWIGLTQGFPRDKKTATIRFALASGSYLTGPRPGFLWSSSDKTPYGSFTIGEIFDHKGNAAVTLTHNLRGCDYRLRVMVDRFPKPKSKLGGFFWKWKARPEERYQPVDGRVVKGGAFNQTFEFPDVPAKEAMVRLPRIDLEVRPIHWVEFRNVALNPGEETRVEIRVNTETPTGDDMAGFGPVIERTINDIDGKLGKECLSLESGEIIDFNEQAIKALPKAEQLKWFDDRSVNLLMDTVGGQRGIGLRNITATLVSKDAWDWDRAALEKAIHPNEPGVEYKDRGGFRWHLVPTNAPLPMTFVLRTGSGRLGIMQVLTFTDNPGGVKIQYKLLKGDPARFSNAPPTQIGNFGPVVERVLPDPDNGSGKGNRETLNLETGEQNSVLDDAPKESGGRLRALVASKGDLFAEYDDFVGKRWALVTAGLKLSDFLTRQWETATPEDLDEALKQPSALQRVEHSGASLYFLPDGLLPLTLAFESREGERGLLQITALNDNPRTVTIRYKLVRVNDANPTVEGFGSELTKAQRVLIVEEAHRAFRSLAEMPQNQRINDDIPERFWGDTIRSLKPVRVVNERVNIKIVLHEIGVIESGFYVNLPISYAPGTGDFLEFVLLSEEHDNSFGQLYRYKVVRSAKTMSFSPIVERILQSPSTERTNAFIDLDTGAVLPPPATLDVKEPWKVDVYSNIWNWAVSSGVDALADTSEQVRGLRWFGVSVAPVADSEWENGTARSIEMAVSKREAKTAFHNMKFPSPGDDRLQAVVSANTLTTISNSSKTFAFRTREKRLGILQLVQVSDEPRGFVKFRYKLVQSSK